MLREIGQLGLIENRVDHRIDGRKTLHRGIFEESSDQIDRIWGRPSEHLLLEKGSAIICMAVLWCVADRRLLNLVSIDYRYISRSVLPSAVSSQRRPPKVLPTPPYSSPNGKHRDLAHRAHDTQRESGPPRSPSAALRTTLASEFGWTCHGPCGLR